MLTVIKINMKYLLLLSGLTLLSCSEKDLKNREISDKELDSILNVNKNEIVFLDLYPDMDDAVFNTAVNRLIKNGKLIRNHDTIVYPFKFDEKSFDFKVYNSTHNIELIYRKEFIEKSDKHRCEHYCDILWNRDNHVEFDYSKKPEIVRGMKFYPIKERKKPYNVLPCYIYDSYSDTKNLMINLFKEKYGEPKLIENNKIVFSDGLKKIFLTFEFNHIQPHSGYFIDKNGYYMAGRYDFYIQYFSNNSLEKLTQEKINDSINQLNKEKEIRINRELEQKKERDKLINDI